MRICVLGHQGMLGHVVARHLENTGHQVLTINHRFVASFAEGFLDAVHRSRPDWCVNCIGVRPDPSISRAHLFDINSRLPELVVAALPRSIGFVQASTDGVFRADRMNRLASEIPDAIDDYGVSKQRAETVVLGAQRHVIRCSIIGPERQTNRSLFSWLLSQKQAVNGYTNQFWNGVTTLEWAKICARLMAGERDGVGRVIQAGFVPALSKYELLRCIADAWRPSLVITPVEAPCVVQRTLVPNLESPPLAEQLRELHEFS